MSISATDRNAWQNLSPEDADRIVRMAWEDRTTFEAIRLQFGLSANDTVRFMRTQLEAKAYKRWRQRATQQGHLKHQINIDHSDSRFKCSRQRSDGSTKGWK